MVPFSLSKSGLKVYESFRKERKETRKEGGERDRGKKEGRKKKTRGKERKSSKENLDWFASIAPSNALLDMKEASIKAYHVNAIYS